MTNEMEYLIHLYTCGSKGICATPPNKTIDWEKLVSIAINQSITYTVAMAIKKSHTGCPSRIKYRLISSLRGAAIKNSIKTDRILELVNRMKNAGIDVIIIKGIDVARYYANPECRVSSDTDLLIKPEDEQKAIKFLKNEGFNVKLRIKTNNHSVGVHPELGMIELHVTLLPDFFKKEVLKKWDFEDNLFENKVEVLFYKLPYYSLNYTENLMFLTHHMIKHFMFNGISLRMIMDNALYSKNNIEKIDKQQYKNALKETRYYYVMQLLFGVAVKYFGFSKTDFPIEPIICNEDISMILDDLEEGGWQGKNNENERIDCWYVYGRKRTIEKKNKSKSINNLNKEFIVGSIATLFLPLENMQEKYPVLNKHQWLYVFCSFHRILVRGPKFLQKSKLISKHFFMDESDLSQAGKQRIEMFRKLKLM